MRLALVCFYCLCVFVYVLYFIATMSFAGYFLPVLFCMLSMLISDSRFDLVWFRLSCDHGWIRSGSVNVRKQQQQQQQQQQQLYTMYYNDVHPYRQPPSSQSRLYRVAHLRTDGVHRQESDGTEPVALKVARVTGTSRFGNTIWTSFCEPLLSSTHVRYRYGPVFVSPFYPPPMCGTDTIGTLNALACY